MLIDLNYGMQRALSAHAVCTISPCKGTMGSRAGDNGGCGRLVLAGSQGAEHNSRADISSLPFPLLWMCLASVLQETMASSWTERVRRQSRDLLLLVLLVLLVAVLFNDIFNSLSWIWPTPHKSDCGFAEVAVVSMLAHPVWLSLK